PRQPNSPRTRLRGAPRHLAGEPQGAPGLPDGRLHPHHRHRLQRHRRGVDAVHRSSHSGPDHHPHRSLLVRERCAERGGPLVHLLHDDLPGRSVLPVPARCEHPLSLPLGRNQDLRPVSGMTVQSTSCVLFFYISVFFSY
ncbi:hypothetical protein EGW08_005245, partial [Elysia chlorotica]